MRSFWNFLRDCWYWFYAGLMSNASNYHLDKQEEERRLIINHAADASRTDEEVHREFLEYVRDYDRPMRLRRTWQLVEELFELRPVMMAKYSRKEQK